MSLFNEVSAILIQVLSLPNNCRTLEEKTPLIGAMPEFDSMAVVNIIIKLEEHFGIKIDDDEISASVFATVGSLLAFIEQKIPKQ